MIGVNVLKGEAITIDGCAFEGVGKGVYTNYRWTRILNNRFEANDYDISFGNDATKSFLSNNVFSSIQAWIENSTNKVIVPSKITSFYFSGLNTEVSQAHYYDFKPIPGVEWNVYNTVQNLNSGINNIDTKVSIDIKVDNPGIVEFWLRTNNVYVIYIGAFYVPIVNQYLHYEFTKGIDNATGQINASPNKVELLWRTESGVTVTCGTGYPKITSTLHIKNLAEL